MSSLPERSRAVAEAGAGRAIVRLAIAALGVAFIGVGFQVDLMAPVLVGALALGYTIGEMGADPDRRYLEGFSEGLVIAPKLD